MTAKWKLSLLALAVIFIAFAEPAAADCKWCVTPTKCDDVEEDAAAGCTEWVGGPCETHGTCIIIETDEQELATAAQLMWADILASGVKVVELETPLFGAQKFVEVADGVLGLFNCEGRLTTVALEEDIDTVAFHPPGEELRAVSISTLHASLTLGS